jgi:hypothetical protein
VGGCFDAGPSRCLACRRFVLLNDTCVADCPPGTRAGAGTDGTCEANSNSNSNSSLGGGAIAGICLVLLVVAAGAVIFIINKKRQPFKSRKDAENKSRKDAENEMEISPPSIVANPLEFPED